LLIAALSKGTSTIQKTSNKLTVVMKELMNDLAIDKIVRVE
jgi:hypothetical protein